MWTLLYFLYTKQPNILSVECRPNNGYNINSFYNRGVEALGYMFQDTETSLIMLGVKKAHGKVIPILLGRTLCVHYLYTWKKLLDAYSNLLSCFEKVSSHSKMKPSQRTKQGQHGTKDTLQLRMYYRRSKLQGDAITDTEVSLAYSGSKENHSKVIPTLWSKTYSDCS